MNRGKLWTFLGGVALVAIPGFCVTRKWMDPSAAVVLIGAGGYLVGAISREWFPHDKPPGN